jgi:hypothetical protein
MQKGKDKRPSDRVASDAGRTLQSPYSTPKDKELAASILANREPKRRPPVKKRKG